MVHSASVGVVVVARSIVHMNIVNILLCVQNPKCKISSSKIRDSQECE